MPDAVAGFRAVVQRLRGEGLHVVERPGWASRGQGTLRPRGMVNHDTVTGAAWSLEAVLRMLDVGHANLRGLLYNWSGDRGGTLYLHGAGTAYHAGGGRWQGLTGNSSVIGYGAHADGRTPEPRAQLLASVALNKVCADVFGFDYRMCADHSEWTSRKVDRYGIDGGAFRVLVRTRQGRPDDEEPTVADILRVLYPREGDGMPPGDPSERVREMQRLVWRCGVRLTVDGRWGPETSASLGQVFGVDPERHSTGNTWALLYLKAAAVEAERIAQDETAQVVRNLQ